MNPYRVLFLLFFINIFNYVDRLALSGVSPLIKAQFMFDDVTVGALGSVFLLSYTIFALPFGIWSDYWKPQKVAAVGVVVWSLATVLTGTATTQWEMFLWRALVGIGEAAYVATAPTLISQRFASGQRAKMLGFYNLGMPLGAALGVAFGGLIGEHLGWQSVFIIVGVPGFALAVLAWFIKDDDSQVRDSIQIPVKREKLSFELVKKSLPKPYWLIVAGYIGISVCYGSVTVFLPLFMTRILNYSVSEAGTVAGIIIGTAGILGAPAGGWIGDRWYKKTPGGRGYTVCLACLMASVCMWIGINLQSSIMFGIAAFFLLWHVGVAAAMVFDTAKAAIWNSAMSITILFMHLFGDVPSSLITGKLSDHFGMIFAFNLLPVALLLGGIAFGLSGLMQAKAAQPQE